jgi:F420-dependent oxidoreductase-like protein
VSARQTKFGVCLPSGWRSNLPDAPAHDQWRYLEDTAKRVDGLGYHSIWLVDHLQPVLDPTDSLFECWTAMAALAVVTQNVRLGQIATCNAFRSPALLAKMAACIDVISDGRLDVCIGAGWYATEFAAFGFEHATPGERLSWLAEAVQLMKRFWTEDNVSFEGRHYRTENSTVYPKPLQKPHLPLWIAGGGERRTLRLVAQYGDWCNIVDTPDVMTHKVEVLKRHCEELGRPSEEIGVSWKGDVVIGATDSEVEAQVDRICKFWADRGHAKFADPEGFKGANLVGTPSRIAEQIDRFREAGCQYFICDFWDVDGDSIELFSEEVVSRSV